MWLTTHLLLQKNLSHTSNVMLISGPVTSTATHPMRETTVPHQLLLLHSSTGLPSRPLNHIREETTEGIHARARGTTT